MSCLSFSIYIYLSIDSIEYLCIYLYFATNSTVSKVSFSFCLQWKIYVHLLEKFCLFVEIHNCKLVHWNGLKGLKYQYDNLLCLNCS